MLHLSLPAAVLAMVPPFLTGRPPFPQAILQSAVLASVDDAPSLLIDDASSEIGGRAAAAEAATDVLFVAIVAVGSLLVPGYVCR